MNTSYFAKYKGDKGVNIALQSPSWFEGENYPKLYPKWPFLIRYKKDKDEKAYTKAYTYQVLCHLDPQQVYDDLKDKTLLCWEKSGDFCHRRIVAEWLERELNVKIDEV